MEPTAMEKALDLKSKVMVLLKACSEVSNYLSIKIDDIQKDSARISEITDSINKATKEKESIENSLVFIKREYENEKKAIETLKESASAQISQMKADAIKDRDEAHTVLSTARAKESEASAKLEEADKLRRELEGKLEKIASIGGK